MAAKAGGVVLSFRQSRTDWKYCIYDKLHNDYGYTEARVDFLIEKLKDPKEFEAPFQA